MKKIILSSILLICFSKVIFSQTEEAAELKRIYESLEYNTIAFDDLKKKWLISDPMFIREIYNRFVVKNALRINSQSVTIDIIKDRSQNIYDGTIYIDLRKRYYDDEIEFFAFLPESEVQKDKPNYLFDPITDGYHLRDILGEKIYQKLQEQSYQFSDITKEYFDSKPGYLFDIKINILEPEVMYWSTTSSERNKYLLSAIGKWGHDLILLPGWYSNSYILGSKITYYKNLSSNPQDYTYSITVGANMDAGRPYKGDRTQTQLRNSGQGVYFKLSGDPLKYLIEGWEDFHMDIEGQITISEYKRNEFFLRDSTRFNSIRNYFSVMLKKKNLFNLFDFGSFEAGLGISSADEHSYLFALRNANLVDLEPKKSGFNRFKHYVVADVGIARSGGLIQQNLNVLFGYNVQGGYGFFGAKAYVTLSDIIGFDVRFYSAFNSDSKKFPTWRPESYIVFSPVIRINY